ncbi:PTS sugar transporter subunit IIA [Gottschalkiaceae bacterium SANA]|nr:PTS sugar transporter subunit IIA [Gottschalkiaceae bacterium SANA]
MSRVSLSGIVSPSNIRLKKSVENREEAIRLAGEVLIDNGIVENSYVDAMVDSCNELGPYIVLVPGVAIPHARPECGANKVGISIVTLNKPIVFGNEENDPVHTVIAIASDNNENHIGIISSLSKFLMDSKRVELLRVAENPKEAIDAVLG